jgi:hypothetical protein
VWRRSRLLALLPGVRRECSIIRDDLRQRSLIPPLRRDIFAAALVAFAVGLAVAMVLENAAVGSTVAGALAASTLAVGTCLGPRRTLAGWRELSNHRRALSQVIAAGAAEAGYLADLVAAHGRAAIDVLCGSAVVGGGYIAAGALAAAAEPAPGPEPVRVPGPASVELPAAWRRPVYESASAGPAIAVRRAFVAGADRVAA